MWSQRWGRRDGSDGNIPRRLPPDALAAAAAPADYTGGRARGTEAEEGAEEEAAGWDARGLGAFALPCPARLARCGREFLPGLCPGGR